MSSTLQVIFIKQMRLKALPSTLFKSLHAVKSISLSKNAIAALPSDVFRGLSTLEYLFFAHNKLTQLEPGLLDDCTSLRLLDASYNGLMTLPDALFRYTGKLDNVKLKSNSLVSLPATLFSHVPLLADVILDENHIESLPRTLLADTPALYRLHLNGNPLRNPLALFEHSHPSMKLQHLHVQRMGLTDGVLQGALLNASQLASSGGERGNATHRLRFLESLYLGGNSLQHVDVSHFPRLKLLNVSNNPVLKGLRLPPASVLDLLDASASQLQLDPGFCGFAGYTFSGASTLIMQRMGSNFAADPRLAAALRFCLAMPITLDMSHTLLTRPGDLSWPVDGPFFPIGKPRSVLTLLEVPVQCNWAQYPLHTRKELKMIAHVHVNTWRERTVVRLDCSCGPRYKADDDTCVEKKKWIEKDGHEPLVIVLAMLASAPLLVYVVMRARRRLRVASGSLELKERLLEGAEHELARLRQAWEIDAAEVVMEEVIAEGAYGQVWCGRYDSVKVAVKVLHKHLLEMEELGGDAAFAQEVSFLQQVHHPHLVRFWGTGALPSGAPFLVLEYVAGGSLRQRLYGQGDSAPTHGVPLSAALPAHLRLRFAHHIALGMAYVHEQGHLHRDLKSDNVLLTSDLRAKVADFGTVRLFRLAAEPLGRNEHLGSDALASSWTASASHVPDATVGLGTPPYMSPEVLMAEPYGVGADIWSYGVLLWEMACCRLPDLVAELGLPPNRGPFRSRLAKLLRQGKRLPLGDEEAHALEPSYIDLMRSCWAKNAEERPPFDEACRLFGLLQSA